MTLIKYGVDSIMKNITSKIKNVTPKLIIIFLYIQPLLDILASFFIKYNIPNYITNIIRFLFLGYLIFYLLINKYENKKLITSYLFTLFITILIHISLLCYFKDISVLYSELRCTLSTYYFLFLLPAFYVIYKNEDFNKVHLRNLFITYLLLTFIPNILGIGFDSYAYSKLGSAGWFYSANVLGSIMLITLISSLEQILKIKLPILIIILLITIYVFLNIGTKTPFLGLLLLILINIIYLIYTLIKKKKTKTLLITIILLTITSISGILILPKTNAYKNIIIHYNYVKENNIDFIDNIIFSERLTFEKRTRKLYNKANVLEKLFGIGYIDDYNLGDYTEKLVEIDYFDILYKEGIIGFILFIIPLVFIVKSYIKNFEFNLTKINNLTLLILILLLALFQGHMFITPSISIFIGLILVVNSKEVKQ